MDPTTALQQLQDALKAASAAAALLAQSLAAPAPAPPTPPTPPAVMVSHTVAVAFTNDSWDGTSATDGHDRNLYIGSVTVDGITLAGDKFTTNTSSGPAIAGQAVMQTNGMATYNILAPAPAKGFADTLNVAVSADLFQGGPAVQLSVDGTLLGIFSVSAHHSQGQTQVLNPCP